MIESGSGPSTQVIKKSSTSSAGGPSAQIVKTSGGGAAEITVNLHYLLYLFSVYLLSLYMFSLDITFSLKNNCQLQITKDVSIPIQRETKVIETSGKVEVCITIKFSLLKLFIAILSHNMLRHPIILTLYDILIPGRISRNGDVNDIFDNEN